jgi:Cdc6-like AAA superfamily ATPase
VASTSDGLVGPVERFVAVVAPAVAGLAEQAGDRDPDAVARTAVTEAAELVAACIDADGLHTDDELRAYTTAIGALDDGSLAGATPAQLRRSGLFAGRRHVLEHPTPLFQLLVDADRERGGARSWAYYRVALDLAHAVAALDVHTSQSELDALARFRACMLAAIEDGGVRRPGPGFFGLTTAALRDAQERVDVGGRAGPPAAGTTSTVAPVDAPREPPRPVEELLAELDALVGLEPVKAEVRLLTNLLVVQRLRADRGLPTTHGSRHLVFTGNPGTGKTTVARLLSEIFHSLGVVSRGHLVETDRSALVAGFVGQTATRTREVIESALGGTLLIDEAYALARGGENDFGREAIDTLVKLMEDHRADLVVVAAGYPDEMATFIGANPGLQSRFPRTLHFPDYSDDELVDIFALIAEAAHYRLGEGTADVVRGRFAAVPRGRGFGNGRLARNLFEATIAHQATRLVEVEDPTDEQLVTIEPVDVPAVPGHLGRGGGTGR